MEWGSDAQVTTNNSQSARATRVGHVNAASRLSAHADDTADCFDTGSDWEVVALRQRASAGFWAARAALVLSVPFAMTAWATGVRHAWLLYMLLPVLASLFAGALFGAAIWSRSQVTDESLAARRGALVALAAYILFALEVACMSATPLETALDVFMGAIFFTGWAVFPCAFLAGILAFRAREGAFRHRRYAGR